MWQNSERNKNCSNHRKNLSKTNHQDFKTQLQHYYPGGCLKFGLGSFKVSNGKVSKFNSLWEKQWLIFQHIHDLSCMSACNCALASTIILSAMTDITYFTLNISIDFFCIPSNFENSKVILWEIAPPDTVEQIY